MWYSDPFLVIPAIFAQAALVCFVIYLLAVSLKAKVTSIIATIFACCFTFVAAFSYFFGYFIRHTDEITGWIGSF